MLTQHQTLLKRCQTPLTRQFKDWKVAKLTFAWLLVKTPTKAQNVYFVYMFNIFKRRKPDLLRNWNIAVDGSFKRIVNDDSVQFINDDASRVLYFSVITVKGDANILGDIYKKMIPKITKTDEGWVLKGAIDEGNEILTCVFSFENQSDGQWAMNLFSEIIFKKVIL